MRILQAGGYIIQKKSLSGKSFYIPRKKVIDGIKRYKTDEEDEEIDEEDQ